MKSLLLLVTSSVLLSSCAGLFTGEPASGPDATPPVGYAPVYIQSTAQMSTQPATKPAFYLSRVEANEPSRIKLFVHLADSSGNYLTNAAKQKIWCTVVDHANGSAKHITDFKIREVTENDRTPTAIALVMDHSGSMGEERARIVQEAADRFIQMKKPEDGIALIKYDHRVATESPLLTDGFMVRNKLQKNGLMGFGGMTAIGDGISEGIVQVANAKGYDRRAVVVFTDGIDNSSSVLKDSVIALARRTNTQVCAIDFGVNTDKQYLTDVADNCGGSYNQVYGSREFDPVFVDVYKKLKNYYVIEYTPRDYGFHTVSLKICLPNDTLYAERSFDNTPMIGAYSIVDVNFDSDKADIKAESRAAVDNIAYLMKAYQGMTIELRGHTDNSNKTGDPNHNTKLSQKRADAVKAALVKAGIESHRITAKGYGESLPIADNTTDEGRARNRRTEFLILSK